MGRKLLIMPPYHPVEYEGDMGREIERRSEMYRGAEMRTGRRDDYRRTEPRMGARDEDYMTMGGSRYFPDERINPYMGDYEPEMRRRRDSRGRYTSARMGGYGEPWMGEDDEMEVRSGPRRVYFPQMNRKIGFSIDGEMEHLPDEVNTDYRSTVDYPQMNEMEHRKGTKAMSGHASGTGAMPFTKEMAMEWAENLENADGTQGPHWTIDQIKKVMAERKIECDPYEFYIAMNATYSDLCKQFQKYGISKIDPYVDFAMAFWLHDKDAPDKLGKYFQYIVE